MKPGLLFLVIASLIALIVVWAGLESLVTWIMMRYAPRMGSSKIYTIAFIAIFMTLLMFVYVLSMLSV